MSDEKLTSYGASVAFSLVVVLDVDIDVFGLALNHEYRCPVLSFCLGRPPDHDMNTRAPASVHGWSFLIHPRQFVAVVVHEMTDEALSDDLFGFGRDVPPFATQGKPEPIVLLMQLARIRRKRYFGSVLGFPGLRSCHAYFPRLNSSPCLQCWPTTLSDHISGSPIQVGRSRWLWSTRHTSMWSSRST